MSEKDVIREEASGLQLTLPAGMCWKGPVGSAHPRWGSAGYDASSGKPRRGSTRKLPPKSLSFFLTPSLAGAVSHKRVCVARVSKRKVKSSLNPSQFGNSRPPRRLQKSRRVGRDTIVRVSATASPDTAAPRARGRRLYSLCVTSPGAAFPRTARKQSRRDLVGRWSPRQWLCSRAKGESWRSKTCCLMVLRRGVCARAVVWLKHFMYRSAGCFAY